MTTPLDPTILGVSGFAVALCLIIIKVLWEKLQEEIKLNRANTEKVIPALLAATHAMTEVAVISNRMAERERGP